MVFGTTVPLGEVGEKGGAEYRTSVFGDGRAAREMVGSADGAGTGVGVGVYVMEMAGAGSAAERQKDSWSERKAWWQHWMVVALCQQIPVNEPLLC